MKKLTGSDLSKYLSLILRHKPDSIGLKLNEYGYADIEELIDKANQNNIQIDKRELHKVIETNNKQRFLVAQNGKCIKATQGHSFQVKLEIDPKEPPEFLYHGTLKELSEVIQIEGIKRMKRSHVHLNSNFLKSYVTGSRTSKEPVVLEIRAKEMFRDGRIFYLTENNVWLTDYVPNKYIRVKDISEVFKLNTIEIVTTSVFKKLNTIKLNRRNEKRKVLSIELNNCFICSTDKSRLTFEKEKVICKESSYDKHRVKHFIPGGINNPQINETDNEVTIKQSGKIQYDSSSSNNLEQGINNMILNHEGTGLWYNCGLCSELNMISNRMTLGEVFKCSNCKEPMIKIEKETKIEMNNCQ